MGMGLGRVTDDRECDRDLVADPDGPRHATPAEEHDRGETYVHEAGKPWRLALTRVVPPRRAHHPHAGLADRVDHLGARDDGALGEPVDQQFHGSGLTIIGTCSSQSSDKSGGARASSQQRATIVTTTRREVAPVPWTVNSLHDPATRLAERCLHSVGTLLKGTRQWPLRVLSLADPERQRPRGRDVKVGAGGLRPLAPTIPMTLKPDPHGPAFSFSCRSCSATLAARSSP